MLSIPEFAANVLPHGTTAVVADPHEIANVLGVDGIRYMLDSSANVPLRVFVMFPSCVPATPFETSGAVLTHTDMEPFKNNERILGLAEMMNFPGLIAGDRRSSLRLRSFKTKFWTGIVPASQEKLWAAYVSAGLVQTTNPHLCQRHWKN